MKTVKILISICVLSLHLGASDMIKISLNQQKDLGVKAQDVQSIAYVEYGQYIGVLVFDKKDIITISSNVESIVDTIHVRELQHVNKGQKLITIKSNALLNKQQEYIQASLEQVSSNENYERNIKLQTQGIISSKKLLESKKIKRSNDLKVTLTGTQLITNGFTNWMLKKIRTENKPIYKITKYAKRSGVISKINVNIGEYLSAEHKMIEMYADGKRFIEVTIPVKSVENINLNDKVSFSNFHAKVTAIGNTVNTASQSVILRAEIQDAKNIMINRVYETKISKSISDAFKIKKSALVFKENKSFVFKQVDSGFEVLEVNIIREGPTCYIIKADLTLNDLVAASSTSALLSAMDSDDE